MKRHLFFFIALAAIILPAQAQVSGNHTVKPVTATTTKPAALAKPAEATGLPAAMPLHFGYFSYKAAFEAMPDYAIAQRDLSDLQSKYQTEMKRVEDEFNQKYELFLEGQRDFAPSILHKRQAELQELMDKNVAFKQEAQRLMKEAEEKVYAPMREKLGAAIQKVGQEKGLAFILNTDNQALPFINAQYGVDVQADIAAAIK